MQAISLNWLNRWLGSGLGALKFLLLTSVVIGAIEFVDSDNKLISATKGRIFVILSDGNVCGDLFPCCEEYDATIYIRE